MAILKASEAKKLSLKEIQEKIKELKLELIKANVTANKTNAKTKEIKRVISRLLTFNKISKEEELNKHK